MKYIHCIDYFHGNWWVRGERNIIAFIFPNNINQLFRNNMSSTFSEQKKINIEVDFLTRYVNR